MKAKRSKIENGITTSLVSKVREIREKRSEKGMTTSLVREIIEKKSEKGMTM